MSQNRTVTQETLSMLDSNTLDNVLQYIDLLHTAVSEGETRQLTELDEVEMVNVLRDLIYTAQETITEIEVTRAKQQRKRLQPMLRILPKQVDKAG
ncbi:MAG: hypothetical protein AAFR81_20555 [Chloroflexota bacterium]